MQLNNCKLGKTGVYNIIEVANTHAGDMKYLDDLVTEILERFSFDNFGIKFQPLAANMIATTDFEWFSVYNELEFSANEWKGVIEKASGQMDVWLDMFDLYSSKILECNLLYVTGIKLQASVLKNYPLINSLSELDLSEMKVIINISGYEIAEIRRIISYLDSKINCKEIILQVGFQSFPTGFVESGLYKIEEIKDSFKNEICFADHLDSNSQGAFALPMLAIEKGCRYIEKHVLLSDRETKYDYHSSFTLEQYNDFINLQIDLYASKSSSFITESEKKYLNGTYQTPILKIGKNVGDLVSVQKDFDFKRSGRKGLNTLEIENKIQSKYIVSSVLNAGDTISSHDIRKANIGTLVACRMKSSRLKRKALLKIGDFSSIENCLLNCKSFEDVNHLVLATSTHVDDSVLSDYCLDSSVIFRQGSEDDVIERYLIIAEELKLDVIIRVTGDMPFVSKEITKILLDSHFENGADFTHAKHFSVGTACEIITVNALKKIKKQIPNPSLSEYMSYYFTNNNDVFKINTVRLPDELVRDYRLTIDYQEDLEMMNKVVSYLSDKNVEVTTSNIFKALDETDMSNINNDVSLIYKVDADLMDRLKAETKIS